MQITTDGILLLMQLDVFENPGCIGYCYRDPVYGWNVCVYARYTCFLKKEQNKKLGFIVSNLCI